MSIEREVYTKEFINESIAEGKEIYLPVSLKENKQLEFYRIYDPDSDTQRGNYGIYEPSAFAENKVINDNIDMIIVPGVAFDLKKNRLGYGGGYYDRFLKGLKSQVTKIGLGYDFQIVDDISVEAFDVHMDIVITETREIF